MCRISHSIIVELLNVFQKADRSFSSRCTFPSIVSRSMQRQSERWRTHLSRACRENFYSTVYARYCIFSEDCDRYFHRVDVFRVHCDPSFSNHNSDNVFVFGIYQFIFFDYLYICLCSFFQSNIFLVHSMYTFHSVQKNWVSKLFSYYMHFEVGVEYRSRIKFIRIKLQ